MTTLCLCGPASEEYFVGKFEDGSDQGDYQMAREVLARQFDAMQIGAALGDCNLIRKEHRPPTMALTILTRGLRDYSSGYAGLLQSVARFRL